MALMSLININNEDKKTLLETAKQSITYGLKNQQVLTIKLQQFSKTLQSHAASFVTLNLNHQLRGCIGTLEAYQPLIKDVAEHAFAAAFQDPRFAPVTENEIHQLQLHISVLTPASPMQFTSEKDLLRQLQPGKDGLILQAEHHKATFLPAVWDQLPEAEEFLNHLKRKAGLNAYAWPEGIQAFRYKTISIE